MNPLANRTFAHSAGKEELTAAQKLLASLPVLTELPPGSPLLGSRYVHAMLVTTYAPDGRFWAAMLARSNAGRIVTLRTSHDLQGAQSTVEARQRAVAAHTANLAVPNPKPDRGVSPIRWMGALPPGVYIVPEVTREILATLSPDPSRLRAASAVAQMLVAAQVGAQYAACALALAGADPLPSEVPTRVLECLRAADTMRSSGKPTRIDLRGEPESDWYVGLEQGSPTNPLLRVLTEHIAQHPSIAPAVEIITRTGESRHFDLAVDPEQPHGTFTCRPAEAPDNAPAPAGQIASLLSPPTASAPARTRYKRTGARTPS